MLSGAMLARARALGLYRHLHRAEVLQHLHHHLQTTPERYAVLPAADVLIYLGDLQDLFAAARRVLLPGGVFAFTAEAAANDVNYELRTSLRCAHGQNYLLKLAAHNGLQVTLLQSAPLRLHEGQPLLGHCALLTRPG